MIIGLNKKCHISRILKVLKIYNFDQLYINSKLRLLNSIRNNNLTQELFNILLKDNTVRIKKSKSFLTDLSFLESYFNVDKALILDSPHSFIRVIKNQLTYRDGISDSIKTCLDNFNNPTYRKMLYDLTKSYETNNITLSQ